ncbi:M23 family metallopeptidase [Cohnella cholangitidis]|uniref:Peptidoglycan DD-metalloendopeptidase family protein n=1 Tax=Cohnella cholangitidis TaxID=2598458 RepID=A0A7G5BVZ8_9BACL|nr:M23 family metallopeptidase [Cohnella cholangitidis]QMV41132.1 peptidoglycan DD-metalloendopeptidase family protein [Cohnella cholangitidis]
MKWRNKKFTFMVIPDANSTVRRFQLSAVILVIGVAVLVALIASSITALLLYRGNTSQIGQLKQQLSKATGDYENIIEEKNNHIDELQTDLADLSEQAKKINSSMNDIKSLESELKEMVGIETEDSAKAKSDGKKSDNDAEDDQFAMDGGTGGEEIPVTDEDMHLLADQTRDDFIDLGSQIEQLKPELELTKKAVAKQQKILAVTPTIWPTDSRRITSTFGVRKDPFTRRATYHAGLDIGGDTGDPIYAAADGTVIEAGRSDSHGNNVLISHGNGLKTHYSHMSKILTTVGTKVSKGDLIGELGSTGRSTGPHLHYEVIINGEHVDPRPYLKATRRS